MKIMKPRSADKQNHTTSSLLQFDPKLQDFQLNWKVVRPWSLVSLRLQVESLKETLTYARGKLLDVGCGSKPYWPLFRTNVEHYIGVDYGQKNATGLQHDAAADGSNLPFKANTFDTVLCTEVIEHLEEPWKAIEEMYRVLKPGGHLILSAPQTYWLHEEPRDFYRFTQFGLKYLMENSGFALKYFKAKGDAGHFLLDLFAKIIRGFTGFMNALLRKFTFGKNQDINELKPFRFLFVHSIRVLLHGYEILRTLTKKNQKENFATGAIALNEKFTLGHVLVGLK
jgi:SAM-dependent methyltransferase